jgi:transposase
VPPGAEALLEKGGGAVLTKLLFPGLAGVRVDRAWRDAAMLHVVVTTTRRRAGCPCCGRRSRRVHNRYERTVADLSCGGTRVTVHLRTRRFWCRVRWCRRRIFCERVPELAAPWARRTVRLQGHLRRTACALGGEPGARLASADATPVSARTVLRLLRAIPLPAAGPVRVLGVDDWARRKGQAFGTILVDLEAHRVLDLLPDRTAATLAAWLGRHPEVEIVRRDRAGAYAEGVRQGAPQARQVADRFHVLKNLTEAMERALSRHHRALRAAAAAVAQAAAGSPSATCRSGLAAPRPTKAQQAQRTRRERRLARYEDVLALHAQGCSQVQIAVALGMGRHTIRRSLRGDGFPERAPAPPRANGVRRYEPYLRERWTAGCDNAAELWHELRAQGYPGAASTVRQYLARWRAHPGRPGKPGPNPVAHRARCGAPPPTIRSYSPRQTTWLLLRDQDRLTDEERAYVDHLRLACPVLARLQTLARAFRELVRQHDLPTLAHWLAQADQSAIPELQGFADGLRADRAAVEAGLTLPWSQGPVEGQVNRVKTLKRAGFGRQQLDLLRLRLLRVA